VSKRHVLLGRSANGETWLDLDRLVVSRLLVQANSGGGKSFLLRRLLEQSHGMIQHLVLDVEGEFHTLREKHDYVLAARSGGDTLADVHTAALLARRLLELGVSAILDLYELKAHDRVRFVRLFLESLVDAPRSLWHPCLIVVDEAHHFCPEKGHGEAESAGAVMDLMTKGRKRGFCGILATQRLSKLNKDAAAEANVKLIGRAALDLDRKRAGDELGLRSEADRDELRVLDPGEFFAFGPGLSDQVVKIHVGPVHTTHPKAGETAAPVPPARGKVKEILSKLADLPREAAHEAKTADELRAEVLRLRREVAAKPKGEDVRVEVPIVDPAYAESLRRCASVLRAVSETLGTTIRSMQSGADEVDANLSKAPRPRPLPAVAAMRSKPIQAAREPRRVDPEANGALTGPEQKVLDAAAWLHSIGVAEPCQPAVAFLAGYSWKGSSFRNPRGALNSKGLIELRGGNLLLTDAGHAAATPQETVLTTDQLHQKVLACLPGPETKILEVLLDAYPDALTQQHVGEATGYSIAGSSFRNPRGKLHSLQLLTFEQDGALRAADFLFLGDRR
jgi:hypothetical protein